MATLVLSYSNYCYIFTCVCVNYHHCKEVSVMAREVMLGKAEMSQELNIVALCPITVAIMNRVYVQIVTFCV